MIFFFSSKVHFSELGWSSLYSIIKTSENFNENTVDMCLTINILMSERVMYTF